VGSHSLHSTRGEAATASAVERVVVSSDVDEFNVSLPMMHGSLHRSSGGGADTVVTVRDHGMLHVGHIDIGYPMAGMVDIADSVVTVAIVLESSEGARWDGVDLRRGHVAIYGPGERHCAIDLAGMAVGFVVVGLDGLDKAVDDLGRHATAAERGILRPDLSDHVLRAFEQVAFSDDPSALVAAIASAVSTGGATGRRNDSKRISSEYVVSRAIGHVLETSDWMPSSLTLCRAVGVSERRLQTAFWEMYGMPPSRFFRQRALSVARARLARADGFAAPVERIATELGFQHTGRFARYYFDQFGELPSATVMTANAGH
jgi:AraC-like DNA-binding protein